MRKDVWFTLGGMGAVAAVVFGCGLLLVSVVLPSGASAAPPPGPGTAAAETPPDPQKLHDLKTQFETAVVRGQFDDARLAVLRAELLVGNKDAQWQRRKADALFYSEDLPAQPRYEQACATYSALAAGSLSPLPAADREWAQFQCGVCLYKLGRYPEALQTFDQFLREHPSTPQTSEAQLLRAQCLLGSGKTDDARSELTHLMTANLPDPVKTQAKTELEHLKTHSPSAVVVPVEDEAPSHSAPGATAPAPAPRTAAPRVETQWDNIVRSLRNGDAQSASQMIDALSRQTELPAERRAQLLLDYAKLLREADQTKKVE